MAIQPTQITITPAPQNGVTGGTGNSSKTAAGDFMDFINPLQHIPGVSTLYQRATGDTLNPIAKIVGGTLIGGPIGFIASLADVLFEQQTGKSLGGTVLAALTGDEAAAESETQIAMADTNVNLGDFAGDVSRMAYASRENLWGDGTTMLAQAPAPAPQVEQVVSAAPVEDQPMQVATLPTPPRSYAVDKKDRDILSLFGGQMESASSAYQKADMLGYLNDVSTNMVL